MQKKQLWKLAALVLLGSLFFIGCVSSKPYAYVPEGSNSASLSLKRGNPNVNFVALDDRMPSQAGRGTRWEPIIVPSGRNLRITVHAYYEHKSAVSVRGGFLGFISQTADALGTLSRGINVDVTFICPPLANGGRYQLSFRKERGIPGQNFLVLTDMDTRKVIVEQEFVYNEDKL